MYLTDHARGILARRRNRSKARDRTRDRLRRAREVGRGPGHLACLPGNPHPSATIHEIAAEMGFELNADPEGADAILFWQSDGRSAFHEPPDELIEVGRQRQVINIGATDISKTKVARVFEEISGLPFLVDPETHCGPAVEKPEGNGIRGGRIVECPTRRVAGFCYQLLVDNRNQAGDRTVDLRPAIFGEEIPYAIQKERFLENRLGTVLQPEITPHFRDASELLSDSEQAMVLELAERLGAEFSEIDCCRDRETGILYPVDLNTTPSHFTAFELDEFDALVKLQAEAFESAFLKSD